MNILVLFMCRYFKIICENVLFSDGLCEFFFDVDVCEDFIWVIFEILNCFVIDFDLFEYNSEIVYVFMYCEELFMMYWMYEVFVEYV